MGHNPSRQSIKATAAQAASDVDEKTRIRFTSVRQHAAWSAAWLRAVAIWLSERRMTWIAAALTVACFTAIEFTGSPREPAIRICGLVLQLIGVITVALELRGRRLVFSFPSASQDLADWLSRWPRYGAKHVEIALRGVSAAFAAGGVTVSAHGLVDGTIEQQIESLRQSVIQLSGAMATVKQSLAQEVSERKATAERDVADRTRQLQELRDKLREVSVGGLRVSVFGVCCVVIGQIMSTLSVELAKFL